MRQTEAGREFPLAKDDPTFCLLRVRTSPFQMTSWAQTLGLCAKAKLEQSTVFQQFNALSIT